VTEEEEEEEEQEQEQEEQEEEEEEEEEERGGGDDGNVHVAWEAHSVYYGSSRLPHFTNKNFPLWYFVDAMVSILLAACFE